MCRFVGKPIALHSSQLIFGHELTNEIDTGLEANPLNLLQVLEAQCLLQVVDAANEITDHQAVL
jgi:hypothetical protein